MPFERTSKYTATRDELIAEILTRLSRGEYLADICRSRGMPDTATVSRWEEKIPGLTQRIVRAREAGEVQRAQDLGRISRGEVGYSTGDVQRDKLIVDTELKLLSKFNPRKWGDRSFVEHTMVDTSDTDAVMERILHILSTGRVKLPGGIEVVRRDEPVALPPPDDFSDLA